MITKILIPLIPAIIILNLIAKKANFKYIKHVFLCSSLSIIFSYFIAKILYYPMGLLYYRLNILIPNLQENQSLNIFFVAFLSSFLQNAIPEEISKRISINVSKPKIEYTIFLNSIIVALCFSVVENYLYVINSNIKYFEFYRIFVPIHLISQLTMAFFMIISFEKKKDNKIAQSKFFTILSLIIPILIHGIYNIYCKLSKWKIIINDIEILPLVIILGIITYIVTIVSIMKINKKYPEIKLENNYVK